jgi:hypothetical protein
MTNSISPIGLNTVSIRNTSHVKFILRNVRTVFGVDVQGGAPVEMAVSLPVVLLLMTGIFSFSTALYQKLQLAEAVSNAGRVLAAEREDSCLLHTRPWNHLVSPDRDQRDLPGHVLPLKLQFHWKAERGIGYILGPRDCRRRQ